MRLGQFLAMLVIAVGMVAVYQGANITPPEPPRRVICDGDCYWITLDDGTKCRVFRGQHIPNRGWPMLCEVNGTTTPYQEYRKTRDEVD